MCTQCNEIKTAKMAASEMARPTEGNSVAMVIIGAFMVGVTALVTYMVTRPATAPTARTVTSETPAYEPPAARTEKKAATRTVFLEKVGDIQFTAISGGIVLHNSSESIRSVDRLFEGAEPLPDNRIFRTMNGDLIVSKDTQVWHAGPLSILGQNRGDAARWVCVGGKKGIYFEVGSHTRIESACLSADGIVRVVLRTSLENSGFRVNTEGSVTSAASGGRTPEWRSTRSSSEYIPWATGEMVVTIKVADVRKDVPADFTEF